MNLGRKPDKADWLLLGRKLTETAILSTFIVVMLGRAGLLAIGIMLAMAIISVIVYPPARLREPPTPGNPPRPIVPNAPKPNE
jgi:hypothetical protein